jgi:hypothetical protein
MKRSLALAGAAMLVGVLAGCGDGDSSTESYCAAVEDAKAEFDSLEEGDFAKIDSALDRMQTLGEQAPEEVKDEWETFNGTIDELRTGLDEAGVSLEDLGALREGEMPEGVDQQKLMELATKMQDLSSDEMREAADRIEQHAKEECDVDLGN